MFRKYQHLQGEADILETQDTKRVNEIKGRVNKKTSLESLMFLLDCPFCMFFLQNNDAEI